jgi:hypothetical protein
MTLLLLIDLVERYQREGNREGNRDGNHKAPAIPGPRKPRSMASPTPVSKLYCL